MNGSGSADTGITANWETDSIGGKWIVLLLMLALWLAALRLCVKGPTFIARKNNCQFWSRTWWRFVIVVNCWILNGLIQPFFKRFQSESIRRLSDLLWGIARVIGLVDPDLRPLLTSKQWPLQPPLAIGWSWFGKAGCISACQKLGSWKSECTAPYRMGSR